MTLKNFLKSQSFKCIVVLLVIALLAGGLLAILHDVLYVSEEEKTQRAIQAIYNKEVSYETIVSSNDGEEFGSQGKVLACYFLAEEEEYLIKTVGYQGYKNGTVTLWVVADFTGGKFCGLGKVAVSDYDKQTLMSNFKDSYFTVFDNADEWTTAGKNFSTRGEIEAVNTGATYTSTAINNGVNVALLYIRGSLSKGGEGE